MQTIDEVKAHCRFVGNGAESDGHRRLIPQNGIRWHADDPHQGQQGR